MRSRLAKGWTLALLSVGLLSASGDAEAFCRTRTQGLAKNCVIRDNQCCMTGKELFWQASCTSYSFSSKGSRHLTLDTARTLVRRAFDSWTSITCTPAGDHPSFEVQEISDTKLTKVGYDKNGPNANIIVFLDDGWPTDDGANALGLTTLSFDVNTGQIFDADMEINTSESRLSISDPVPQDGFDLETVFVHEAGHFFGLAHSPVRDATMFAFYSPGSLDMRSLATDDIEGLCAIYPPGGVRDNGVTATAAGCTTPRGGFNNGEPGSVSHGCSVSPSSSDSSGGAWGIAFGATVALGAVAWGRRRKTPT